MVGWGRKRSRAPESEPQTGQWRARSTAAAIGFAFSYLWILLGTDSSIIEGLFSSLQYGWTGGLRNASLWVLYYEVLRRIPYCHLYRFAPIFAAAVWLLDAPLSAALWWLEWQVRSDVPPYMEQVFVDPKTWRPSLGLNVFTASNLLHAIAVVATNLWLHTRSFSLRVASDKGESFTKGWEGYDMGQVSEHPGNSESTRYLCASAVLHGQAFRRAILDHFPSRGRAVAPELGLDAELLARVCQHLDLRNRRYCAAFAGIGGGALLFWLVTGLAMFPLLAVLLTAALYFRLMSEEKQTALTYFTKELYTPETVRTVFAAYLPPEVLEGIPASDQNLVVYGGFVPFVGAGQPAGGWSFVVDLNKAKDDAHAGARPADFALEELSVAVGAAVNSLGLPGLRQQDMYLVHGADIRKNANVLPDECGRPAQTIEMRMATRLDDVNDLSIRRYTWVTIADWAKELTVSYFIRCSKKGHTLFCECSSYLLTPVHNQYRKIDSTIPDDFQSLGSRVTLALIVGPFYAVFAVLRLLAICLVPGMRYGTTQESNTAKLWRRTLCLTME